MDLFCRAVSTFMDNVWITFDIDYNDSFRKNMNSFDRLINENENSQYKSEIRVFFKPNSFTTANIGFENINNNTDGDWSDYQSFSDDNDRKISFNINTDLRFFKIDARFYQTDKNYDYFIEILGITDILKNQIICIEVLRLF